MQKNLRYHSNIDEGIMGYVARTGRYVNVADMAESQFYDEDRHSDYQGTGVNVQSVLAFPVFGMGLDPTERGSVTHVIEVINKSSDGGFSNNDEEIIAAIASHVTVTLADDETRSNFKAVIEMCKAQVNSRQKLQAGGAG